MGISTSGVIRAEGQAAAAVLTGDKFVIQRKGTTATDSYYQPLEATAALMGSFVLGGKTVLAVGQATLSSGTVTVTLAAITAGALVFVTPNDATPNALGVVVTAGANFAITSASGADSSVVNYIVLI